MKTKIVLLLLLFAVTFSCKESNINPPPQLNLSDRISASEEFKNTLIWTKAIFRFSAVQIMAASEDKRKILLNRKDELLQKQQLTEAEILELFNIPKYELFKVHANQLRENLSNLMANYPELKNLDESERNSILGESVEKFRATHSVASQVILKTKNRSGREETCDSDLDACYDTAMDTYLFQTIACGVLGTGAGVLGFIFLGPAGAGVGLVVGYGCAGSATVGASKKLAACYKADDLCRHPTSNVSHFDDEVYNIVYTAAAWQEVYSPLFYEAPDGHIYWY